MALLLRLAEAWAVQQLLRTPAFHRAVEKVARQVHRVRHGTPPEELGGTNLDDPNLPSFIRHFADELKTQLGNAERQETSGAARAEGVEDNSVNARRGGSEPGEHDSDAAWEHIRQSTRRTESRKPAERVAENAEGAWRSVQQSGTRAPKQGFMGEYMDAFRDQINNKSGR
ncbi:hypothetical protein AC579_7679 [Pseudocercospora musae]|uniref:Uncharacterized protein n=1 Tax=Pseudocercospora musae TaxID=113226 RepID=A0A139IB68_9PEZI|nr:hypothetical protein AC579_7679 [Pseudocercospora musae]